MVEPHLECFKQLFGLVLNEYNNIFAANLSAGPLNFMSNVVPTCFFVFSACFCAHLWLSVHSNITIGIERTARPVGMQSAMITWEGWGLVFT